MKQLYASSMMVLLLSACGQKGPLYLPDPAGQRTPTTTAAASSHLAERL